MLLRISLGENTYLALYLVTIYPTLCNTEPCPWILHIPYDPTSSFATVVVVFILTCNSIRAYDNLGGIPEVPVSLRTVESSVWLQSDKQCFVPRTLVAIRLFL